MRWATRAAPHVDRVASAWLIRRVVDEGATFVFVDDPDDVPADAEPFDMRGARLSHRGDDCTFETILRQHDVADPVLWELARMVHDADLGDERYGVPEAPGLDSVLRALPLVCSDDDALAIGMRLFDGLYELCRQRALRRNGDTGPD